MAKKTKKLQLDLSDLDNSELLGVIRDLQKARESIESAFYWGDTKEGNSYWGTVYNNLGNIIEFHQDELNARLVKEDAEKPSPLEKQKEALLIARKVINAAWAESECNSVQESALDMGEHAIALAEEFLEINGEIDI